MWKPLRVHKSKNPLAHPAETPLAGLNNKKKKEDKHICIDKRQNIYDEKKTFQQMTYKFAYKQLNSHLFG